MEGSLRRNAMEEETPRRGGGSMIELLGKQIDELKKRGELVAHNKNSPFSNDILTHVVEPGFRVPDLQKYDGTKDPHEHITAFELVINLYGQPGPIMAKLFVTTLAGKTQEWFTSLPSGSVESYEQLIQKFSFHFASKRKQKSILIHGLKKGQFTFALARYPPDDVEQLMALAQMYIDEEEMNAMKDLERREREQIYHRPQEASEGRGTRMKNDKPREPKYQPKYHTYTPLTVTRVKALMLVENADLLKCPIHTRDIRGCKTGKDEVRRSRSRIQDRNPGPIKTNKAPANRSNEPTKGVIYTIAGGSSVGDSKRTRKSSDRLGDTGAMNDPMVIKLDIANFTVHKVLVDSGSSANIIFKSVIDRMGLKNARLEPLKTPLVGLGGSEVALLGMIELPVSMGVEPKRRTLMMKFPTEHGIGEVVCGQKEAQKCYNLSVKGEYGQKKR
ncbi:uncharacterized protein LOC105156437 [Sesamum indicum]|uniref:Uncharacterized protein LOC105156437 n=1 Tax=Sesamum indicum TaxID=4182 RepID=A0A8M8UQU1_SESIN|nr:uncharacterized protein LOC105156437 [Sesamum indicum]